MRCVPAEFINECGHTLGPQGGAGRPPGAAKSSGVGSCPGGPDHVGVQHVGVVDGQKAGPGGVGGPGGQGPGSLP